MRTLILEDDFVSQVLMRKLLEPYGDCDVFDNGVEALEEFKHAQKSSSRYDLVCLDIMVPEMDGQQVLKEIRAIEKELGILDGHGVKVMMTTALKDSRNVLSAFREFCDGYITKPIEKTKLLATLRELRLIE